MDKVITPAQRLTGTVCLPGDKSISHRYAMLAALANGPSRIDHFSTGADCHSTLRCLRALGIPTRVENTTVHIDGAGLDGLHAPAAPLDAGNSGSTIRMLSGILAAQPFSSEIAGDASLARRPMRRILEPLSQMGARIEARDGNFPPLRITGSPLHGIDYQLPVPSAQVKTAVLLAGLFADSPTTVREPVRTRDHTEIALRELGASISVRPGVIQIEPRPTLEARHLVVPSDLSSAAFFLVAALLLPGSDVVLQGVGLNPTRSALLDVLSGMGARIQVVDLREQAGELIGDIRVCASSLTASHRGAGASAAGVPEGSLTALRAGSTTAAVLEGPVTAAVIDEIPVLAVLGAVSEAGLIVKDAAELRVKETDRIATIVENLGRMGVAVTVSPDGFTVPGRAAGAPRLRAAELDSFGDHRIAMAFAVAALAADGPCVLHGAEAASVSFPEFYEILDSLKA